MICSGDERLQARQPYGMGLQIPSGMDDEVPLSGVGGRCGLAMSRVAQGDSDEQGDDNLCGLD